MHPVVATVEQWGRIRAAEIELASTASELEDFVVANPDHDLEFEYFSLTLKQVSRLFTALVGDAEARDRLVQCAIRDRPPSRALVSRAHALEAVRVAIPQTSRNLRRSGTTRDVYNAYRSQSTYSLFGIGVLLEDMAAHSRFSEHLLCSAVARVAFKEETEIPPWAPETRLLVDRPSSPQSP
jgi:hypothetical protein